jgi:hypothetical protein
VDDRLLAMDRNRIRLGAGQLGSSAKTSRGLGGRPLGTSSWRLGLDCRPLAVKSKLSDDYSPGAGVGRHQPRTLAKNSGTTIVASDSMMNFGVSIFSLPQVIFSLGTAPEYDPKLVVESLI